MSADESRYLLYTQGDGDSGTYYFGDRTKGQVSPIAYRYPQLTADLLNGSRRVSYPASDGTSSEALLTLPMTPPKGAAPENLPAVVFLDDIGRAGFDYWSEFLANRGYAVLRIDARGFVQAGPQQWG